MSAARPWVIIGNPENRRVALFQDALDGCGRPPADVLSYYDLLTRRRSIGEVPDGAIARIDSPGENFAVEKLLLKAGADSAAAEGGPSLDAQRIDKLPDDPGRILYPRQWFLGFRETLRSWGHALQHASDVWLLSQPADIASMFDKSQCHGQCNAADLPAPTTVGEVSSFDELMHRMDELGLERVFVKLAHGSSASGVVALHRRRERIEAITSAELVPTDGEVRLYNSLRIRRYADVADVRVLVDTLAQHRVHVEEWLPKASVGGRVCDMRVLVIAGEPQHCVVRTSRTPLTNLHLGNRRGSVDELLGKLSPAHQQSLDETCRRAAQLYPDTLHIGLDILFTPGCRQHFVLEINAFGDLLPGVLHCGRSTYVAEIDAALSKRRVGSRAKVSGLKAVSRSRT